MDSYDMLIVGAGCSGLSAAMYGTRLGMKTLTIGELPGGLITTTHLVENWPGIKSISGPDLAMSLYDHAQSFGAEIRSEKVQSIKNLTPERDDVTPLFEIVTGSNTYRSKTVLIATGTVHRRLNVPGEKEFEHKGVSFCALCDGAFFKGKVVAVVGGGDSAAKEALFLSEHAEKVYMLVRKTSVKAEPINMRRIEENEKIEVLYNSEVEEVLGGDNVEGLALKGGGKLAVDGVFVAIGHTAQTQLAKDLGVKLNHHDEIIIDRNSATNIRGVFGAGDCCDSVFKQAITGSAEAVTACYFAYQLCG